MIATLPAELSITARTLRQRLVTTSAKAKIPHLGSCLSCVELLVQLYWHELRIDPRNPEDPDRDRFLLSKGHGAPILFQVLAERGFFPISRLDDFGKAGSVFHEHPPNRGTFPASKRPRAPWATACPWHSAWPWQPASNNGRAGAMRF